MNNYTQFNHSKLRSRKYSTMFSQSAVKKKPTTILSSTFLSSTDYYIESVTLFKYNDIDKRFNLNTDVAYARYNGCKISTKIREELEKI